MTQRQIKTGYFLVEGLNSFATTLYLYYFYFFTQTRFGFGDKANLLLAAASGLLYALGAWWGGRFAQKAGYFAALKTGFAIMLVAMLAGIWSTGAAVQVGLLLLATVGICFTWPALEALASDGESPARLPRVVGIYNLVWAGTGALAYFVGGALFDWFGLDSIFYVPVGCVVVQLAITFRLERAARALTEKTKLEPSRLALPPDPHRPSAARANSFLRMAWLANPFAYIATNTLIAVMPGIAHRLELSTTMAGVCGSVWCFARLAAFFGLWRWTGWHYRFRWLLASYLALMGAFAIMLSIPNLTVLILAQLAFGTALGLIYYSSLFYSMDAGDSKGEHGGIHEAAIGLGNFAGPAVGAASLQFFPQHTSNGVIAVSMLLLGGLAGLVIIARKTKT
jgi:predicted MFS family arabinose efflux permease